MKQEDYFGLCYSGGVRQKMSPEEFSAMFCRVCRQQECKRAGAGQTAWLQRVLTQEERLLTNPQFAREGDPQFREISEQKFEDLFKKAVASHIADIKGDWEPVSQLDVARFAAGTLQPTPFQPTPEPPPEDLPEPGEDSNEPVIEWEVRIPSSQGTTYDVSLGGLPGQEMQWHCTCKAFRFGDGSHCKHIKQAEQVYARSMQMKLDENKPPAHFVPPTPLPETPKPPVIRPDPNAEAPRRALGNTRIPDEGLMIGGGPPPPPDATPAPDPWAVPQKPTSVVEVGARIRMGLGTLKREP